MAETISAEAPQLLLSLVKGPDQFAQILENGLVPSDFGSLSRVLEFISDYYEKKEIFPDTSLLNYQFPGVFLDVQADFDFALEETKKWVIEKRVESALSEHLAGNLDVPGLITRLEEARSISPRKELIRYSDAMVLERFEKWKEYRDHPKSSTILRGIRTGLPTIDKTRFGFEPGEFICIFGRPEQGKSLLLLNFGVTAWLSGHKCLYISPEMSVAKVELRFDTLVAGQLGIHISNKKLRLGEGITEPNYQKLIDAQKDRQDFRITTRMSAEEIHSIVVAEKPKVVLVDGTYLIPGKSKSQWERITETCESLKNTANETGCIVLAVNQAVKDNKLISRPPRVDEIAGGDATERQVDKLISIYNPDQMPNSRYLGILKDRDGGWEEARQNPMQLLFEPDRGIIREIT